MLHAPMPWPTEARARQRPSRGGVTHSGPRDWSDPRDKLAQEPYRHCVARYEYDEEASERLHMDVVYEVDDRPAPVARWVDAMRALNSINDPLARQLIALHRNCGSGSGECDLADDEGIPVNARHAWGCETTAIIASHFGIEYPSPR